MRQHTGTLLLITASFLMVLAFGLAFYWVPPAKEFAERYGNGHIAKLIFVHVPLAIVSFVAFTTAAGFGVAYLLTRDRRWDALEQATVEVGWLYAVLATATGAYFSRLAWGEWWSWDPRQTTMFLVLLTYTAYLLVREAIDDSDRRAAVSAVYAVLGAIASVFLYWVVPYLPTVMQASAHPSGIIAKGGLDFAYRTVLRLSLLGFLLVCIQLVRLRAAITLLKWRQQMAALYRGEA